MVRFQSSAAASKHADMLVYNALLFRHYRVPVHGILLLLRPQAAHANRNGLIRYAARPRQGSMEVGYEGIRLGKRPVKEFLGGNLGTVPLAVLGRPPESMELEEGIQAVAQQLAERLEKAASPDQARKPLRPAFVLAGMRLRRESVQQVFQGVRTMPVDLRDSDTFMAILEEGETKALHRTLLRIGPKRSSRKPLLSDRGPHSEEGRYALRDHSGGC